MDSVIAAVEKMLRENIDDLRETITGLDSAALNWSPAPEVNSIAVLTAHAVSATRALSESAIDGRMNREKYMAEERTPAFATREATAEQLLALVTGLEGLADRLALVPPAAYSGEEITYEGPPGESRTRAWSLLHAIEHLREHIGHAQLTRQLYEARA